MVVRVLTLVVAAALVIGAATQFGWASFDDDDAGYSVDDDRPADPATAMPATAITVVERDRHAAPLAWEVASRPGRLHAVSVFRPPRA